MAVEISIDTGGGEGRLTEEEWEKLSPEEQWRRAGYNIVWEGGVPASALRAPASCGGPLPEQRQPESPICPPSTGRQDLSPLTAAIIPCSSWVCNHAPGCGLLVKDGTEWWSCRPAPWPSTNLARMNEWHTVGVDSFVYSFRHSLMAWVVVAWGGTRGRADVRRTSQVRRTFL